MARETIHLVQAYSIGKGDRLRPDTPIPCKSSEEACRTAKRLAQSKVGVVAFSTSGDAELGEYDDQPTFIFKAGQLPEQFGDR